VTVAVDPVGDLPPDALALLIAESEREGWRFVRRLADEWAVGTNRFDRPGEALFAASVDGALVGVCGLNVDPYAADPAVGRVRRLYVLQAFRGRGVGRRLVHAVIQSARARFRSLRVRTEGAAAGRLYGRLGFVPAVGVPDCTHILVLGTTTESADEQAQLMREYNKKLRDLSRKPDEPAGRADQLVQEFEREREAQAKRDAERYRGERRMELVLVASSLLLGPGLIWSGNGVLWCTKPGST
jgi:GNAT superfamily N-acetyltransferase